MSSVGNIITTFATATALGAVSIFCPPLAVPAIITIGTTGATATYVGIKTGDKELENFGESLMAGTSLAL